MGFWLNICYLMKTAVWIEKYYLSSYLSFEEAATCSHPPWWAWSSYLFPSVTFIPSYHRPLHAKQTWSPGKCFSWDCFKTTPNEIKEVDAHDCTAKLTMVQVHFWMLCILIFDFRSHFLTRRAHEMSFQHEFCNGWMNIRWEFLFPVDTLIRAAGGCNSSTACNGWRSTVGSFIQCLFMFTGKWNKKHETVLRSSMQLKTLMPFL